jgi:hypothetical protein
MKPRITVDLTANGEFEIWLNGTGRDLLIRQLNGLSEKNDHFHLGPSPIGEVEVCTRGYRAELKVSEFGTVFFRTDDWDRQYFPHVLSDAT